MMMLSKRALALMILALMAATAATAATAFAGTKKRVILQMEQVADPIEGSSQAHLNAKARNLYSPNQTAGVMIKLGRVSR